MKMVKIPAYTVLELLIVMIITSIVVALTYSGFQKIYQHYERFNMSQKQILSLIMMDREIRKDFEAADMLLKTEDGFVCNYHDRPIRYIFSENYLLRQELDRYDTFLIKATQTEIFFMKQTLTTQVFDELVFMDSDNRRSFHYRKKYAGDILIKYSKQ
jgi:hypothetical protein